jgi:hypothetical protein
MSSEKHENASSRDEQAKEDFVCAMDFAEQMMNEFEEMGLQRKNALGGALTAIITHLIASAPDTQTAMFMLSACISNAVHNIDRTAVSHPTNDEIH